MNALLLRNLGGLRRSSSLQSFAEYRQAEAQNPQMSSVTSEGTLLEYETLELRIHPPNVVIDNDTYDDVTVITIDSANRPGTLVEASLEVPGSEGPESRVKGQGEWRVRLRAARRVTPCCGPSVNTWTCIHACTATL